MKRIIMFGAGKMAREYCQMVTNDVTILAVADNHYLDMDGFAGHLVINPDDIGNYDVDYVVIAIDDLKCGNDIEVLHIYDQLLKLGVPDEKIVLQSFKYRKNHPQHKPRTQFVKNLAAIFKQEQINGAVAECGVYRGWFSGMISEVFETQTLYLFDTFEGFNADDVAAENASAQEWVKNGAHDRLKNTSEKIVKLRCYNRSRVILKKGYVPETLAGIEDQFCFVNLDMDLYKPQHAALEFFGERMVRGGVILKHDYFSSVLPGTYKAVSVFSHKEDYNIIPIGDELSIALIRK